MVNQVIHAPAATATAAVMPTAPAVGLWDRTYGRSGAASTRYGTTRMIDSYRSSSDSRPLSGGRTVTAPPSLRLVPAEEAGRKDPRDQGPRRHYAQVLRPGIYSHPAVAYRVQGRTERGEVADLAHRGGHLLGREVDTGQEHVREEQQPPDPRRAPGGRRHARGQQAGREQ